MLSERDFDDVALRLMAQRTPSQHANHGFDASFLRRRITEQQKHRLFMRLEALFKAWTGESFIAFTVRRSSPAGRTALSDQGERNGHG